MSNKALLFIFLASLFLVVIGKGDIDVGRIVVVIVIFLTGKYLKDRFDDLENECKSLKDRIDDLDGRC